eukprot:4988763-Prymnesium_polylepis.1
MAACRCWPYRKAAAEHRSRQPVHAPLDGDVDQLCGRVAGAIDVGGVAWPRHLQRRGGGKCHGDFVPEAIGRHEIGTDVDQVGELSGERTGVHVDRVSRQLHDTRVQTAKAGCRVSDAVTHTKRAKLTMLGVAIGFCCSDSALLRGGERSTQRARVLCGDAGAKLRLFVASAAASSSSKRTNQSLERACAVR